MHPPASPDPEKPRAYVALVALAMMACSPDAQPAPEATAPIAPPSPPADTIVVVGDPADPLNAPPSCAGGPSSTNTGELMLAGKPCLNCHDQTFTLAGTVYATGHEPDLCRGVDAGAATVVVTDHDGRVVELPTNAAGNFWTPVPLSFPVRVHLADAAGKTRRMESELSLAMRNCNACHTQLGYGSPRPPGRITAPP